MQRDRLSRSLLISLMLSSVVLLGKQCPGLNPMARMELQDAGVDKYIGQFTPAVSEDIGGGFFKHTFDPDDGNGPLCIGGTPFTTFTQRGDRRKLLIFLDGGGACWQDFYFCSALADDVLPAEPGGIFADVFDPGAGLIDNPFADWSKVFISYCDGSVFVGDNDVVDPRFPSGPVRHHRGLRNLTAAMDLARAEFPAARQIMVSGSSAGGVGAASFAPFLARFIFGNKKRLTVFNDAGPIAGNPLPLPPLLDAVAARAADWDFAKFFPASCTDCDALASEASAIIRWRLDNDSTVRESYYATDGDATNGFFTVLLDQASYRAAMVPVQEALHAAHPTRYKAFIRSGDDSHTALANPLFYLGTANGVPLWEWTRDFVRGRRGRRGWQHIVEDFVPIP